MNYIDTAFIMICTIFVFFMTPGLAIFYGGLTKRRNVIGIMVQCFISIAIVSLVWSVCGFSISYGTDVMGVVGGADFLFLKNVSVGANRFLAPQLPFVLFFAFQLVFAIITPALIAGAIAERISFYPYCLFIALWSIFVYSPIVHCVWGNGFFSQIGVVDFAGGIPIHLAAGVSSYVAAKVIGARKKVDSTPCNMAYVSIGTGILWAGWFAFNAGSALAANESAALAIANTLLASAAGVFGWLALSLYYSRRIALLDTLLGAVAGLIVITPMAGYVNLCWSFPVGAMGAVVSFVAVRFRLSRGLDDALDVWALHGVAGGFGVVLTGILANPQIAPVAGAVYGNCMQVGVQLLAVVLVVLYASLVTFLLLKFISAITPLRGNDCIEESGFDDAVHKESLYCND